ncbi:hypothetical protein VE02_05384 [Pseudogymnoascus sp. 03VT05]|nr:hypothetical protein VE02_05384 [Pseudogymnoascus sp. 03VT05]
MSEPWIETQITELVAEHGTFPPPYIKHPNIHPLEIFWRMGSGESYIMFPPPPVWLTWMIDLLWVPEGEEMDLDPEEADYFKHFLRTKALGFGTEDECKSAWFLYNEELETEFKNGEEDDE